MSDAVYRQQARVKVTVLPDAAAVAVAAARHFRARASAAIASAGRFTVALSGGSTPKAMFAEVVKEQGLDWSKIHVFWGDERAVPPSHVDSNYRMAKECLLGHVPLPDANIHRIQTELAPSLAAKAYDEELRRFFKLDAEGLPRFDLILLGMGEDGHTASLFPNTMALHETQRLVVSNFVPKLDAERITLTYPVLNAAAWVIAHICGPAKSAAVRAVLDTEPRSELLPMQGVRPLHGELLWLLDQPAAAALAAAGE